MRLIKAIAGASFLLASVAASATVDHEADLQQMLGKRVEAGPPVDCLQVGTITNSYIVDGTAIIYEVSGGDMYVNRPETNASSLNRHNVLVTDMETSALLTVARSLGVKAGSLCVASVDNITRSKIDSAAMEDCEMHLFAVALETVTRIPLD